MKVQTVLIGGTNQKGNSKYAELDLRDGVSKITTEKYAGQKRPHYYLKNGIYAPWWTLDQHLENLEIEGFDELDTNNIVKVDMIEHIRRHSYGYIAYLKDGNTASVSVNMAKKYSHLIKE